MEHTSHCDITMYTDTGYGIREYLTSVWRWDDRFETDLDVSVCVCPCVREGEDSQAGVLLSG